MKIRNGFVSNSSSSSFIVFGQNAKSFCDHIEDGKIINRLDVADYVWWEFIYDIFDKNQEIKFIPDRLWKIDFPSKLGFHKALPESIKDNNISSFKDYEEIFEKWFIINYSRYPFYEIEFSDHPGETKYLEENMNDFVYDYRNNYDSNCFTVNNH